MSDFLIYHLMKDLYSDLTISIILVALTKKDNSAWRNRCEFFTGRPAIKEFLNRKWQKETQYKLKKELWSFTENRISVRFEYEWFDKNNSTWMRTHGNEHWEFNTEGLMTKRDMSANDYPISEEDRRL